MGHLSPEWSWQLPPGLGASCSIVGIPTLLLGRVPCRWSSFRWETFRIRDKLWKRWGKIASTYRRRLTVCCVGIAQDSDDETFDTLNSMVTEADAFGARSSFHVPSLDALSLSTIVNSMSSLLSSTKTEMTDLATGETRAVCSRCQKRAQGKPSTT
jgi:hypothetical protein